MEDKFERDMYSSIEEFGEQEVEKKEEQSEENIKAEEQRAADLQKGFNDAYQQAYGYTAQTGEPLEIEIPEGSEAYQEGFKKAIVEATKDAQEDYEGMLAAEQRLFGEEDQSYGRK